MKHTHHIYTFQEAIADGFTAEEAPIVIKVDLMTEYWDRLTEAEKEEYFRDCKTLRI